MEFMCKEEIFNILKEQSEDVGKDLIAFLGISELTPFFVESTYLQYWSKELDGLPEEEGLEDLEVTLQPVEPDEPDGNQLVQFCISCWLDDNQTELDQVFLHLTPSPEHDGRYALQIYRGSGNEDEDFDCNLVYDRNYDQEERTEWLINCMANDLTDENGKFLFEGDPVNV